METFHLVFLGGVVAIMVLADKHAALWLFGKSERLPHEKTIALHRAMWGALIGMLVTGTLLSYEHISYYVQTPVFIAKMCFVGTLLLNAVLLGILMKRASTISFKELPFSEKCIFVVSGGISCVSWLCAASIGYFLL